MSIITYPLNGVTYDAEDVSTYLCTRTSGVYAKDTNYAVSVTGARQIAGFGSARSVQAAEIAQILAMGTSEGPPAGA